LNKKLKTKNYLSQNIKWDQVDLDIIKRLLKHCVEEEVGPNHIYNPIDGDITTVACSLKDRSKAQLTARDDLVCCGIEMVNLIFSAFKTKSLHFKSNYRDGEQVKKNEVIASIQGNTHEILLVERTLLNFLQKLSGISTYTSRLVQKINPFGVNLLDTRKTTPGHRLLDKYATACGGAYNHRMGLFDRILIKDNHLAAKNINCTQDFINFISTIRKSNPNIFLQVEVDSAEFALSMTSNVVDAILLDNFSPDEIKDVIQKLDPDIITEASGCVSATNIESYAESKPDFISTGAPTHSSTWSDIGLDWCD
jgi:nicotinate-nucleotide pyrophosphorylase (carboxylating)